MAGAERIAELKGMSKDELQAVCRQQVRERNVTVITLAYCELKSLAQRISFKAKFKEAELVKLIMDEEGLEEEEATTPSDKKGKAKAAKGKAKSPSAPSDGSANSSAPITPVA